MLISYGASYSHIGFGANGTAGMVDPCFDLALERVLIRHARAGVQKYVGDQCILSYFNVFRIVQNHSMAMCMCVPVEGSI